MGTSPRLLLRYPELSDAANVPTDMHNLTSDIEASIGGFLPTPKTGRTSTSQGVTNINGNGWTLLNPLVTLLNPHATLFLLVAIDGSATVNSVNTVTYGDTKVTGAAGLHTGVAPRVMNDWRDTRMRSIATIAPGATLSAQLQASRLAGAGSDVLNCDMILTPIGWLKTGTIA